MDQKKKKSLLSTIITFGTLILFLGFGFYNRNTDEIDLIFLSNSEVKKCINEAEKASEIVSGYRFSCAMDEAVKIYPTDRQKAINLCVKYHILGFEDESGRKQREFECGLIFQLEDIDPNPDSSPVQDESSLPDINLPEGYILSSRINDLSGDSYRFRITSDSDHWELSVITLETIEELDRTCPPGECMRSEILYPSKETYLSDSDKISSKDFDLLNLNNASYLMVTTPVAGDVGFMNYYITYFDNNRVILSRWSEDQTPDEGSTLFLKELEILKL